MGERGNIRIIDSPDAPSVYLYTHWRGHELEDIARAALAKHWRWDDPSYLARIVFCEMVRGHEAEENSFGISPHEMDMNYPTLVIDVPRQVVYVSAEREVSFAAFAPGIRMTGETL